MSEPPDNSIDNSKDDLVTDGVPYDASPQYVEEIAGLLKRGPQTIDDLAEGLDYSSGLMRRNLRFGTELRFFTETDGHFELTERGKTLGHMGLSEDTEWVFQDAVKNYPFYKRLLEVLLARGNVIEIRGKAALPQDSIHECIRNVFEFELGDRVLTGAVRTFMRTLDAAGYGRYVRGDGDYPTRVVLNEAITEFGNIYGNKDEASGKEESRPETQTASEQEDEDDEVEVSFDSAKTIIEITVDISEDSNTEILAEKVDTFERALTEKRES